MTALVCVLLLTGVPSADTSDPGALLKDATRLQNTAKYEAALALFQRFVKEHPKDPALPLAYQGLGTCLLETRQFNEAVAALDRALALWPKGESTWSLRWNRAVACFRRAEQTRKAEDLLEA